MSYKSQKKSSKQFTIPISIALALFGVVILWNQEIFESNHIPTKVTLSPLRCCEAWCWQWCSTWTMKDPAMNVLFFTFWGTFAFNNPNNLIASYVLKVTFGTICFKKDMFWMSISSDWSLKERIPMFVLKTSTILVKEKDL